MSLLPLNVGHRYPNPIPSDTRVPNWAYIDVVVCFISLRFYVTAGAENVPLLETTQTANNWSVAAAQSAGGESVLVL